MIWPRTIQARLTFGYAVAFAVGLIVFATISVKSLDASLKAVVDARIDNAATMIGTLLASDPNVTHQTRNRIDLVTGANLSSVVFSQRGKALYSSAIAIPPAMREVTLRADNEPRMQTFRITGLTGRIVTQRIVTANGAFLYVGVWRQLDLVESLERFRLIGFITAAVLICISALLVGSFVARQGLLPLRAVAELASEIEAHDLSRRLDIGDRSELGQLATTFDRMLARLDDAFERQRRFTADASHELRAPLAVVHIAAELALRRDRDPAGYQRVLSSILAATKQLEDLTDRLLLAARADEGYVTIERIDFSGLVGETLEHLTPLAQSKRVNLVARINVEAYIDGDRSSLSRAIIVLVDNAIKYSPADGAVTALVTQERSTVLLTVADEGPGFSSEGLQHATDRFWRSDTSRARGSGSGLGLAICESIVRASGATIALQNANRGARVLLEFPLATNA